MSITLLSPKGSNSQAPRHMAPRLVALDGLKIGLLSNSKLNADLLLEQTAAQFVEHYGCSVLPMLNKGHGSKPAEPEHISQLAAEADFLITATGD